ncbi:MAG: right-handed parallel beta-helix repeat-containing protein [Chloroflexi bacterium]|nr:right-handed parallel beta-helix repeat-containing protein [Chloroflexota bacterium]
MSILTRLRQQKLLLMLLLLGIIGVLITRSWPVIGDQSPLAVSTAGVPAPTNQLITATSVTPPQRGANVPWQEYEAEHGTGKATILGPSREFGSLAAESSGRQSVELKQTGQYIQITTTAAANSIVMRYAIPDAPQGGGISATLSLYIDDVFRQKLPLTSRFAWVYGGATATDNHPESGGGHAFFDEVRALVGEIPAGSRLKLQKDPDDQADFYVIDLIDLELVGPALKQPASFISLTDDCGAIADDQRDDRAAFEACIGQAQAAGQGLWIPAGNFDLLSPASQRMGMPVADLTIRGAGMWYSQLRGPWARFYCTGDRCRFHDLAIIGETQTRQDSNPENAFNGGAGKDSLLENVWVEHTKVGWWVGEGDKNVTDGLVIRNSRFRNLFADGVNLCNGSSNSVVENSHFRNTGDDALASWSPAFEGGLNTNNIFRFNTIQLPWRANCLAVYGGKDIQIEDNLCADVVTYPGILIAQQFKSHPFSGTIQIERNSLIRAGGSMWNQEHGAFKLHAAEGVVQGVVVNDLLIDSPTYAGIHLQGSAKLQAITLHNITITNPATAGILLSTSAQGHAEFSNVTVVNPGQTGLISNPLPGQFTLTKGTGNRGW